MKKMHNNKITTYIVIILIVLGSGFFPTISIEDNRLDVGYTKINALSTQNIFGGTVSVLTYCPCSGNYLVYIGLPRPGLFVYYPGTQGYYNFNMPFATYALGLYTPGGTCLMYALYGCITYGQPEGTISYVTGSSL